MMKPNLITTYLLVFMLALWLSSVSNNKLLREAISGTNLQSFSTRWISITLKMNKLPWFTLSSKKISSFSKKSKCVFALKDLLYGRLKQKTKAKAVFLLPFFLFKLSYILLKVWRWVTHSAKNTVSYLRNVYGSCSSKQ